MYFPQIIEMNEGRHQIVCAPHSKTVEVNTCSLQARSAFKAVGSFGPGYPLLAEICKSYSRDTSAPKPGAEYITPSRRRLRTLRKAGKELCECKSLRIQRKASGILHKGWQCNMHSSGVDRYLFAVALWLCVLGGEWTLLEVCWCSWLWRCSFCLPAGVAAAGKSGRADSLF